MYSTGYIEQHESLCIVRNVFFFSLNAGLNTFSMANILGSLYTPSYLVPYELVQIPTV